MVDPRAGDDDGVRSRTELPDEVAALGRGVGDEEVDAVGDALLGPQAPGRFVHEYDGIRRAVLRCGG